MYKISLTLISLMFLAGAEAIAQQRLVKVASDPYPPWSEGEVGAETAKGIAVEIARELFQRMNMRTRVVVYPFKRGLDRIEHGEEDVILMVSRSPDRDRYMLFSQPIRHVQFVLYHSKDRKDFDWDHWEDLKSYRIGSVSGHNIGEEWKAAVLKHELRIEEVKTDVFNLKKIMLGRIDLAVTDREVMQRLIEQNPEYHGKLTWHKKPVFESVNNLGISRKSFFGDDASPHRRGARGNEGRRDVPENILPPWKRIRWKLRNQLDNRGALPEN